MKNTCVIVSPLATVSGYGARSRDIIRSIISLDKYDVKLVSTRWGDTPLNALTAGKDDDLLSRLVPNITEQPDVFIQITVPNEFQPIGKYNIGITAGIETDLCSAEWITGCNKMDLVIVPSKHSKTTFERSKYDKKDSNTNVTIGEHSITKPIEVLFEGLNCNVYKKTDELNKSIVDELNTIPEKWAYLFCGHWLKGELGEDRKNVGMLIKTFLETFKNKQNTPALILKTSGAGFSYIDQEELIRKINLIKQTVQAVRLPNVYLLHGDLTDSEMNSLYLHPKVKAHVSITKGEGFGRPLLEAAISGKPIIASNWSGHVDFLNKDYCTLLPGQLTKVHPSAVWENVLVPESSWFTVDYNYFAGALKDVYENYDKYLEKSRKMTKYVKDNFTLDLMTEKLSELLTKYVPDIPKKVELKLPKLKKIELPKLTKVE